jgi:hypothetical protein
MAQKPDFTPVDKHARDRQEAERLDLEMHARLEAGFPGFRPGERHTAGANR